MNKTEIKKIINKIVDDVLKTEKTEPVKKRSYQKAEKAVIEYYKAKKSKPCNISNKIFSDIQTAIKIIRSDDEYCGLIEMIYFNGWTREECAEFYGVDPVTITRNKVRIIERIATIVFTDDVVEEITGK